MSHQLAAVLIPLRTRGGTLEIYLVQRAPHLSFLGGFHSFPGGTIDAADEALDAAGLAESAHHSAALREAFEELGALPRDIPLPTSREAVLNDAQHWERWVQARGGLPAIELIPMGRWITPPFATKQFDALYFATWFDGDEPITLDARENAAGLWVSPSSAIEMHDRGELFISYPVLETLKVISEYQGDVDAASRALRNRNGTYDHEGGEMVAGAHIIPVRTPTLPPATHTNCYLLGREELVVVDPASPYEDEQARIERYLDHLARRGHRVREIWLTHHHRDHIGGVERLRSRISVPVAAHRLTAEALGAALPVDRFIEDDECTVFDAPGGQDRWRALHTPGHARGHLCFYEETRGHLVTGDLVVSSGTVVVAAPDGDMIDYLRSLERVRDLPRHGFLFPAHGPPVATARRRIEAYLEHRRARERAILESLSTPRRVSEVVPVVYADVPQAAWPLAGANVESHLRKLERDGQVLRGNDGLWSVRSPID